METPWNITEHELEGQHLRFYDICTANDPEVSLKISVKQYRPKSNPNPQTGDVTFIVAGSLGYSKEVYEPFFDDLLAAWQNTGSSNAIRNIWIADMAHQGKSFIMNENNLGNEPSHYDHALDLLHMVNVFREEMMEPLVGVGHSIGATQLVYLSVLHPRLLKALVLVETVIHPYDPRKMENAYLALVIGSILKQDTWDSQEHAEKDHLASPFYKSWDPRALALHLQYGFRDTPSVLYPQMGKRTLVNTKHHETLTLTQANRHSAEFVKFHSSNSSNLDASNAVAAQIVPFLREETRDCFTLLPRLYPPTLFVDGSSTLFHATTAEMRKARIEAKGSLLRHDGFLREDQEDMGSESQVLEGGHFLPMENSLALANSVASFVASKIQLWRVKHDSRRRQWRQMSARERQMVPPDWIGVLGMMSKGKFKERLSRM